MLHRNIRNIKWDNPCKVPSKVPYLAGSQGGHGMSALLVLSDSEPGKLIAEMVS